MIKPWLASRPLKVRTIHEILCEIIEKEGEYKYTVINNRKLLLSSFTFEEIFIAAQLYETFMQEDLQQIVDNFQLNQERVDLGYLYLRISRTIVMVVPFLHILWQIRSEINEFISKVSVFRKTHYFSELNRINLPILK